MYRSVIRTYYICCITFILAKAEYSFDIVDIEWNVTTTNNCEMFWEISKPSRGVFGVSGFMDIKEDINTDNAKGYVNIYYSSNAITYMLTPFRIPPTVFTDGVNFLYKEFLMKTMTTCCENPIEFEGKFVSPLTKRRMVCKDCLFSSENFPSRIRSGFYRMVGISLGELAFAITVTIKLENE